MSTFMMKLINGGDHEYRFLSPALIAVYVGIGSPKPIWAPIFFASIEYLRVLF